jgi:hypothetical protein
MKSKIDVVVDMDGMGLGWEHEYRHGDVDGLGQDHGYRHGEGHGLKQGRGFMFQ